MFWYKTTHTLGVTTDKPEDALSQAKTFVSQGQLDGIDELFVSVGTPERGLVGNENDEGFLIPVTYTGRAGSAEEHRGFILKEVFNAFAWIIDKRLIEGVKGLVIPLECAPAEQTDDPRTLNSDMRRLVRLARDQLIAELERDAVDLEERGLCFHERIPAYNILPSAYALGYTPESLRCFQKTIEVVSSKLISYPVTHLSSTAEELAAAAILTRMSGELEENFLWMETVSESFDWQRAEHTIRALRIETFDEEDTGGLPSSLCEEFVPTSAGGYSADLASAVVQSWFGTPAQPPL